jgi:hypothetical protein
MRKEIKQLLADINEPLTDEEACAVIKLFGQNQDSCFGIDWSLVHLIETAPGWPLQKCLDQENNEWISIRCQRANAGRNQWKCTTRKST